MLSASLAALLGLFGFAPAAAAAAVPFPWLVKSADGSALPGEGLVLLVMGLLCASILCAYPNPYCSAVLGRLRARGRALPGEASRSGEGRRDGCARTWKNRLAG